MNPTFIITTILALLLVAAALMISTASARRGIEQFANGLLVNITAKGHATRLADASFTQRYLLAKAGSDASHIAICTASDKPLGVVPDATPTTDIAASDLSYPLPVNFLGLNEDTERMVASGVIALDAHVVPDAAGKVRSLPTSGGGTTYIVGKAVSAAAADLDQIEVIPCFPYLVTIAR